MRKYHFDLVDHVTVADQGGQELPDDADAMQFGEHLSEHLRLIRPELVGKGYAVLVTDEDGIEIHRSPIDIERVQQH